MPKLHLSAILAVALAFGLAPARAQAPHPATTPATTPAPVLPRGTTPAPAAPSAAAPAAAKPAAATPAPAKPTPAGTTAAPTPKVDINTATAAQLDALPQIGQARAKAIIAGRPYDSLDDLVRRKILSQFVLDKAKPGMAIANINTSTATDLAKTLPGIGDVRAAAIVAARPYAGPQDLVTKKVLTDGIYDKIKDMIAW